MKLKASCLGLQDPFSAGIMSFPLGAIKKAFSFPSGREGFIAPDISFMRINSWPYNITIYKICQLFLVNVPPSIEAGASCFNENSTTAPRNC